MKSLHEQALRQIDRILETLRALIATTTTANQIFGNREEYDEAEVSKASETLEKAWRDFDQQSPRVEALTVYLGDQDFKDFDFSFLDAAGIKHVHAEGIRSLYLALDDVKYRFSLPEQKSNWMNHALQLEQVLMKAREFDSDNQETYENGPVPPNSFRWRGKVYRPIAKGPFLALAAAWQNDGRCIDQSDLAMALGDSEDLLADNTLPSIRGELNDFFRQHVIPLHALVKGSSLAIQDGPPRVGAKKNMKNKTLEAKRPSKKKSR